MADTDDENTEEEPSIEEILDSIRQIISDDDEESDVDIDAGEIDDSVDDPVEEAIDEDDLIELTDKVEEEAISESEDNTAQEEDDAESEPEEAVQEELDEEPEEEVQPEKELVEVEMRDSEHEEQDHEESDIFTEAAETAAYDGFEKLVKQTAVEYQGITLEEIVRTELRPLLRNWLDDNLPSIIERLVEEELRRVSKQVIGDD